MSRSLWTLFIALSVFAVNLIALSLIEFGGSPSKVTGVGVLRGFAPLFFAIGALWILSGMCLLYLPQIFKHLLSR